VAGLRVGLAGMEPGHYGCDEFRFMTSLYEKCDFHVHTRFSPCASPDMRVSSILETCAGRGIKYLGITDHVAAETDTRFLAEARRELASIDGPVRVFLGCEADVLGVGRHVVTEEMRETLDFVCVSANHFHTRSVAQPENGSPETLGRHFLDMFAYACSLGFADFIAHPLMVFPGTFDPRFLDLIEDDDVVPALKSAKRNNIAMEISPRALDREQLYFRMRFLFQCKEMGLKFAVGSDAHRLELVGQTRLIAPIVRELQLEDEDIWLPRGAD